MGLPGKKTAAEYLPWEDLVFFIHQLERDKQYKLCLLASMCSFWALRIGDALSLKWNDLFEPGTDIVKKSFILVENKNLDKRKREGKATKTREIDINEDIGSLIHRLYNKIYYRPRPGQESRSKRKTDYIFFDRYGEQVISEQYLNRVLKKFANKYRLKIENFSSHSFRKSFGRKVLRDHNFSPETKELLIKIYGHPDWSITKVYLGFTKEETSDIYKNLKL